jgi:hypothetical protein
MGYTFNRAAFRRVLPITPSTATLLDVYAALVLIELALKEHLNLLSTNQNRGHDVPSLLLRVANNLPAAFAHHKHVCNQLSVSLGDAIAALWCQGTNGAACKAPRSSYPYIRYLRHDSDWPPDHSTSANLVSLATQVARTSSFLKGSIGVSL